jgi:hypothetical protein
MRRGGLLAGVYRGAPELSGCRAPTRGLRICFCAEPSSARLTHVYAGVIELARLKVNPFTLAVDVPFYDALGRWCGGSRYGSEQFCLRRNRNTRRAKNFGLTIPVTPIPWRNKRTAPKAPTGRASGFFIWNILFGVTDKCQCPSLLHHPGV